MRYILYFCINPLYIYQDDLLTCMYIYLIMCNKNSYISGNNLLNCKDRTNRNALFMHNTLLSSQQTRDDNQDDKSKTCSKATQIILTVVSHNAFIQFESNHVNNIQINMLKIYRCLPCLCDFVMCNYKSSTYFTSCLCPLHAHKKIHNSVVVLVKCGNVMVHAPVDPRPYVLFNACSYRYSLMYDRRVPGHFLVFFRLWKSTDVN